MSRLDSLLHSLLYTYSKLDSFLNNFSATSRLEESLLQSPS
jgi:hypothetical protein